MSHKIPRSSDDDYSAEIIAERQQFIKEKTGAELDHSTRF